MSARAEARLRELTLYSSARKLHSEMSAVEKLEREVQLLPPGQFAEFAAWFNRLQNEQWDREMDDDAASGKLSFLFEEAEAESKQKQLRDWPSSK